MTINRARKLTVFFYSAAVLLLIAGLLPIGVLLSRVCKIGFFVCVLAGFLICYTFCRCPRCGRVLRATFRPISSCPFCGADIHLDNTDQ